jgi:hypothetical protein
LTVTYPSDLFPGDSSCAGIDNAAGMAKYPVNC